jgi:hypothetical protein
VLKRIISAVKMAEFDGMSYIIHRCRWCHIIVVNVHAPTWDKIDDVKDNFYEEPECVFDKFSKYHMKMLLEIFQCQSSQGRYLKPAIGNESLH